MKPYAANQSSVYTPMVAIMGMGSIMPVVVTKKAGVS